MDEYSNESVAVKGREEIFLFASPLNLHESIKRRLVLEGGLDGVVNTELTRVALKNKICYQSEQSVAGCVNEIMADLLLYHSQQPLRSVWPVWQASDAFTQRLATRVGSRRHAELIYMLELVLPGMSIVYYGEEMGLKDETV